jgi:phosphoribosylaminoimidazole carboxylase PurE protein
MTQVHIVLGSASDLESIKDSKISATLTQMGISNQVSVCSAHRNIEALGEFTLEAIKDGAKVFIGVAGMAAALPGALAGLTNMTIPVIGVPLDQYGIDSCIYMPPGVPVLTAGVGKTGLKQAAIAAAQILAVGDAEVFASLATYLEKTKKSPKFNVNLEEETK